MSNSILCEKRSLRCFLPMCTKNCKSCETFKQTIETCYYHHIKFNVFHERRFERWNLHYSFLKKISEVRLSDWNHYIYQRYSCEMFAISLTCVYSNCNISYMLPNSSTQKMPLSHDKGISTYYNYFNSISTFISLSIPLQSTLITFVLCGGFW